MQPPPPAVIAFAKGVLDELLRIHADTPTQETFSVGFPIDNVWYLESRDGRDLIRRAAPKTLSMAEACADGCRAVLVVCSSKVREGSTAGYDASLIIYYRSPNEDEASDPRFDRPVPLATVHIPAGDLVHLAAVLDPAAPRPALLELRPERLDSHFLLEILQLSLDESVAVVLELGRVDEGYIEDMKSCPDGAKREAAALLKEGQWIFRARERDGNRILRTFPEYRAFDLPRLVPES